MDHDTTDDKQRRRTIGMGLFLVGTLIVLTIWSKLDPAPPQPQFYYPDPTPFVVHNEYNFLSKNDLCIGVCR